MASIKSYKLKTVKNVGNTSFQMGVTMVLADNKNTQKRF